MYLRKRHTTRRQSAKSNVTTIYLNPSYQISIQHVWTFLYLHFISKNVIASIFYVTTTIRPERCYINNITVADFMGFHPYRAMTENNNNILFYTVVVCRNIVWGKIGTIENFELMKISSVTILPYKRRSESIFIFRWINANDIFVSAMFPMLSYHTYCYCSHYVTRTFLESHWILCFHAATLWI